MRIPQRPPPFAGFNQWPPERFARVWALSEQWAATGRYLHWDEIRRRPPPEGFTHEEWWFGLKLARNVRFREVGLRDRDGRAFGVSMPDSLTEMLHKIDRGLGFSLKIPAAVTAPGSRDRYVISSLVDEAITSSQLEGASTTRDVAREMLRTQRAPRDVSERMILNNYRTMQRIRELGDSRLTPALVFELQATLTEQTLEHADGGGRFRRADEIIQVVDDRDDVILHDPPPAHELPERMDKLCAFANGESPAFFVHPVIRAILLHFWLAYDHPFVDGNGRTARALFYWCMIRHRYELFEFISISQVIHRAPAKYAQAFLHSETDENDLTYFVLHQAEVISKAITELHDYIARKTGEMHEAEQRLRAIDGLNYRQQALISHALREPHARYLIVGHQNSHNVTHQTARDDLFGLVELGLLTKNKEGRSYVFRPAADLDARLAVPRPTAASFDRNLTLPLE